jgi:hypothetical protein
MTSLSNCGLIGKGNPKTIHHASGRIDAQRVQWVTLGYQAPPEILDDRTWHPLCRSSSVVKLCGARPNRPLPPWQAIGARTYLHPAPVER